MASITEGVNRASIEARTGSEAMSRVAGATIEARATAVDVKSLADTLSGEAESLDGQVRRFLAAVQAAEADNGRVHRVRQSVAPITGSRCDAVTRAVSRGGASRGEPLDWS